MTIYGQILKYREVTFITIEFASVLYAANGIA